MAFEFEAHDSLLARVISSNGELVDVSTFVEYDGGTPDILKMEVNPVGARAVELFYLPKDSDFEKPGRVVGLSADVKGSAIKRGEWYMAFFVRRGEDTKVYPIFTGYVTSDFFGGLGFFEHSASGRGFTRSIALADPAAGAEYATQTVPTNTLWRLKGFSGTLVSSADAANRRPTVRITDGSNEVFRAVGRNSQSASLTTLWSGFQPTDAKANSDDVSTGFSGSLSSVQDLREIPEAYEVTFVTESLQGADDWGAGRLLVEEWMHE